jgi:translation initiation factor 1A
MPKNKKKGSKKKINRNTELIFAEDLQAYARVDNQCGDGRFDLFCFDINKNRMGTIRGSIKKFTWINRDDTVLISLREFDNNRCDIIHKYNNDEVLRLQKLNEIPNNIMHIEDSQKNIDYNIEFTSI